MSESQHLTQLAEVAPGDDFRAHWPVFKELAWFNTPTLAPVADTVAAAMVRAIQRWGTADFAIDEWEADVEASRTCIARRLGRPSDSVSLVGSLAEAAAIVANSIRAGRVVVSAEDFRSNLFPWLALRDRGFEVVEVPARDGLVRDADLIDAITTDTTLVAISAVTSWDGHRRDAQAITRAAHAAGAQAFVNLTQSEGVLPCEFAEEIPEYVAGHAYKWLLAPRGTGYLSVSEDALGNTAPLIPSWRSVSDPYSEFFGGPYQTASDASRLDAPPVWLSWVGARAALELIGRLDPVAVEQHCIGLAEECRGALARLGMEPMAMNLSHIVAARTDNAEEYVAALAERGIRAAANRDRFRVGFHAFNTANDLDRLVATLEEVVSTSG